MRVASPITLHARTIKLPLWKHTSGSSVTSFLGYTSMSEYSLLAVRADLLSPSSSATGRAFPDVAAQARRFEIVIEGEVTYTKGTSCSAPTFAAIVALLNDFLISEGKPPLGFLNPLLYSKGVAGLNDITSGNNPGCGTPGFSAVQGWDPVTGLGTPDFGKLQAVVGG
ncbi:hypothetical protein EVG20_g11593 [Dentipellis fragilis]|uniref:Peptidase S53 domain-containing protein n=1 Tax=Dentipellis fragilis TaxID=205917 RepID=A0A4Y9XK33_9AGAM|nr:hypothetical protein EVG20_g11593 [Dentipellis fragilis]